jgi:hypothetical protein
MYLTHSHSRYSLFSKCASYSFYLHAFAEVVPLAWDALPFHSFLTPSLKSYFRYNLFQEALPALCMSSAVSIQ